jgi:2',3'-cyclic-nucleotide 2'-phosphodiesterase (5'-nucleotidase family)
VPARALAPLDEAARGGVTILHTNDLHSSIDARPGARGGGLARIASTIAAARAVGPTFVVDSGDSVFGGGTWWCARDAGATSRLMSVAGYDLAAIGNHDLEHGQASLRELVAGGRRLVSTNLQFDDQDLQVAIAPAYVVDVGGLRIGVLGVTTTMTLQLVPRSTLEGVEYLESPRTIVRAVDAISPLVHTVIILSHLGFDHASDSDVQLIPALRNSRVSAILGGHTHEALDPAYVIDGITTCNAGAHGVNVNQVTLTRTANGSIGIRSKLLPQDDNVPDSEEFLAARTAELRDFTPFQHERASLPRLPIVASKAPPSGPSKDRELTLLSAALRASGIGSADSIQMVPYLYLLGQLPEADSASHLDVLTAFPNAEQLIEMDLTGADLQQLIGLQNGLTFSYSALPVWLASGLEVSVNDVHTDSVYHVVLTELAGEGGLNWSVLRDGERPTRPLGVTCADLVWRYLATLPDESSA